MIMDICKSWKWIKEKIRLFMTACVLVTMNKLIIVIYKIKWTNWLKLKKIIKRNIKNLLELEPGPNPDFPGPAVRKPGILIKHGFSGLKSGKSIPGFFSILPFLILIHIAWFSIFTFLLDFLLLGNSQLFNLLTIIKYLSFMKCCN